MAIVNRNAARRRRRSEGVSRLPALVLSTRKVPLTWMLATILMVMSLLLVLSLLSSQSSLLIMEAQETWVIPPPFLFQNRHRQIYSATYTTPSSSLNGWWWTQQKKHQPAVPRPLPEEPLANLKDLNFLLNGGFCPLVQGCTKLLPIREAWSSPDILSAAQEQAPKKENNNNQWALVQIPRSHNRSFPFLTRDASHDTIISQSIQKGIAFDPHIRDAIIRGIQEYQQHYTAPSPSNNEHADNNENDVPVFIDAGANLGLFTSYALNMGAKVISIEPMRVNVGVMLNTVRRNGWQHRHWLYHNALHFEPLQVQMKPTDPEINLSNGYIYNSTCSSLIDTGNNRVGATDVMTRTDANAKDESLSLRYGVDYMDAVTLDQIMLTHHPSIRHIAMMKLDVETFEPQVLNGAMRLLCHRTVHRIVMEVQFNTNTYYQQQQQQLQNTNNRSPACNMSHMLSTLEHQLGYKITDTSGFFKYTAEDWHSDKLPPDILLTLKDPSMTPYQRLKMEHAVNNPCEGFEVV